MSAQVDSKDVKRQLYDASKPQERQSDVSRGKSPSSNSHPLLVSFDSRHHAMQSIEGYYQTQPPPGFSLKRRSRSPSPQSNKVRRSTSCLSSRRRLTDSPSFRAASRAIVLRTHDLHQSRPATRQQRRSHALD